MLTVLAVAATVALLAGALAVVAAWLCARHPFCVAAAALSAGVAVVGGPLAVVVAWTLVLGGVFALRTHRRDSFDRWVLRRWRRTFVFGWRWHWAMAMCDLDRAGRRGVRCVPRLGTMCSTRWTDTLSVHPLEGQDAATFAARADELARMFRAASCSALWDAAGVVRLELRRGDPLIRPVPPACIPAHPDLASLRLGVREDGAPWSVSVADGHILVVGPSGAETRSVVWTLLRSLAVSVHEGQVELWGLDGAGGPGLGRGAEMFTHLALTGPEESASLLETATTRLRHRSGRERRHPRGEPFAPPPLVLLVLYDLTRWGPCVDESLRRRLVSALELLLDYGPPAGIVLVATAPMADADFAGRFAQRVTLGGAGTRHADPPEVGYATTRGRDPVRVRFSRMEDAEISATAAGFPARPRTADRRAGGADHALALDA